MPAPQPITGVIASMKPKIKPARRASVRRGLSSAAPLPRAAANASADMLNARAKVAKRFIRSEPTGQEQCAPGAWPDRSCGDVPQSREAAEQAQFDWQ